MSKQSWLKCGVNSQFWNVIVVPTILRLREERCEICGSNEKLDVHHTSYEIQTIETLKVLCRQCHMDQHGIQRFTDEEFVVLYNQNKNDREISETFDVSKSQILRRRNKLNLKSVRSKLGECLGEGKI